MTNPPISPRPQSMAVRAMPLSMANPGDTVRIVRIHAIGPDVQEMIAGGLTVGRVCPVLCRLPGDGVLLGLDDRRLAVGGAAAPEIWVRLIDR